MFYDSRLMKSKTFGSAWKAAHNINSESTSSESAEPSLDKLCTKLAQWVESDEADMPSRRLSLRTSSTLVAGAALLYEKKVEELLADLKKTADMMSGVKKPRRESSQTEESEVPDPRPRKIKYKRSRTVKRKNADSPHYSCHHYCSADSDNEPNE